MRLSSACRPRRGAIVGAAIQQRSRRAALSLGFAACSRRRDLAAPRMSATTHARAPARLRGRGARRALRRRRRDPLRAHARRARARPARRRGDLAARDPADRRRGHWRQRRYGNCAGGPRSCSGSLDRRRRGRRPDRDVAPGGHAAPALRPAPARRRGATAWRPRRPAPYPSAHDRQRRSGSRSSTSRSAGSSSSSRRTIPRSSDSSARRVASSPSGRSPTSASA